MVPTPRQFPQPPVWGPWCSSSARFHRITPLAQPRVAPMIKVCTNHFRLSAKIGLHSPLQVLADPVAPRYVAGVAWHCYAGEVSAQTAVHDAHPDKDAY